MGNLAKDHIVLRNLAPVLLDRSNFTLSAIIHYNFFYVFFFSDFIAKIGPVRSISSFFCPFRAIEISFQTPLQP